MAAKHQQTAETPLFVSSLLAIEAEKCQHRSQTREIKAVSHNATIEQLFFDVHSRFDDIKIEASCSVRKV